MLFPAGMRLHPDVEVILVGDDAGTAEVCAEFGIRHIAAGEAESVWDEIFGGYL